MIEWFQSFLPYLQQLGVAGYWLLALVTFGESFVLTGMFVPGTVLLIIMGGLVPAGYYDFGGLALFAVCGSIFGDSLSYELGRLGRLHVDRYKFLSDYLHHGRAYFNAHGGKSVFMGRFIGPIRPIIPFIAGVSDMNRLPFYIYNFLSAIGWSICYLFLGVVFGYAWKRALAWSSVVVGVVVIIAILVYAFLWLQKRKKSSSS